MIDVNNNLEYKEWAKKEIPYGDRRIQKLTYLAWCARGVVIRKKDHDKKN